MAGQGQPDETTVIATGFGDTHPHSLLHAISLIEQWSFNERTSGDIDPQVVTSPAFMDFMMVGWRSSLHAFLITFLTLPLSFLVERNVLPIFGTHNPSVSDIILAFSMSVSHPLAISLFLASLFSRCFLGETVRKAISALVGWGILASKFLFTVFGFFIYHIVYFRLFTPSRVQEIVGFLSGFLPYSVLSPVETFLYGLRDALIPSAWVLVGVFLLQAGILGFGYLVAWRRTAKARRLAERWAV